MSFRFRSGEGVGKAVRRVATKQADGALVALAAQADDPHARIHEARTSVKKLRGLVRLVGPALGRKRQRRQDRRLQRLARRLADLRDAEVLLRTFDGLVSRTEVRPAALRQVRARLADDAASAAPAELDRRLAEAANGWRKQRRRLRRLTLARGGWKALAPGLEATYRQARRAMKKALGDGSSAAFHDWRKPVKYHGYQIRLLADVDPDGLGARSELVDRLGELLGEDHDLALLGCALAESGCCPDRELRRQLADLARRRQATLRGRARVLGEQLFGERPAAFTARMRADWRAWRSGQAGGADGRPGLAGPRPLFGPDRPAASAAPH